MKIKLTVICPDCDLINEVTFESTQESEAHVIVFPKLEHVKKSRTVSLYTCRVCDSTHAVSLVLSDHK